MANLDVALLGNGVGKATPAWRTLFNQRLLLLLPISIAGPAVGSLGMCKKDSVCG